MKYFYNPPAVIKLIFNDFIWDSNSDKILLTFDDGPNTGTTEIILNILEKNKISAVFFCVGNNIKKYPSLCKNIISENHLIGNHTFNHKIITELSKEESDKEIDSVTHLLKEEFNYEVKYFRPPHGKFNFKTKKELKDKNLKNIMWSLMTHDYKNDLNLVKFAVRKHLNKNSIIVLHDNIKSKDIIESSIQFILEESERKNFKIGKPAECLK